MENLLQLAKRKYQKHLDRRALNELESPEIRSIPEELRCEEAPSVPLIFGVIGAGKVFDRWMRDMLCIPKDLKISVKGIYDGSAELMRKKAEAYRIPICYDSFASMLSDPEIGAVYVATPNYLHASHAIQALEAGKHVLCEKPIAMNCAELERMYQAAEAHGVFLMEGMWMRTVPLMRTVLQVLAEGTVGEVRYLHADCCNNDSPAAYPALFSREKGGGALMDVGCYALHLAHSVFAGQPELSSAAKLTESGVDLTSAAVLRFPAGLAVLAQSLGCVGGAQAEIRGTKGRIVISRYLDSPSEFTVIAANGKRTVFRYLTPREKRPIGYAYEILAFADAVRSGRLSCELVPAEITKTVAKEMEQIRRDCGVSFAGDRYDAD